MQQRAQACSTAGPPLALVGFPADGARDIPTDVVPFYDLLTARIDNLGAMSFRLESATGGMGLTADANHQWTFDLVPNELLAPQTTYTLSMSLAGEQAAPPLTFTTGSGPVATAPQRPRASLVHYALDDDYATSCSPAWSGTCVAVASGLPVEAAFIDEFGQLDSVAYLYQAPWFTNLSGIDQGTNDACVRLRSRAPNGTYSEPLDLCGKDAPLVSLDGSEPIACTSAGITQDGELVHPDADCDCSAPGTGSRGSGLPALFGLFLLARRWRWR